MEINWDNPAEAYRILTDRPARPKQNYSDEQHDIIRTVLSGKSVMVDAVAGSGKTTTILGIAENTTDLILNLTYNSKLKLEVQQKISDRNLDNIKCYSYHSFMYNMYRTKGYTDKEMQTIIDNRQKTSQPIQPYKYIIIDETQDMTVLYYKFVMLIIAQIQDAYKFHPVMVLMGDQYQCIYGFKGSDGRYLTSSQHLYGGEFQTMQLKCSYRLTIPIVKFINKYCFGYERLVSTRPGIPVQYFTSNPYGQDMDCIVSLILNMIKYENFTAEDFFILTPSTRINPGKSKVPFKILENKLVAKGCKCYVVNDDQTPSAELYNNKVVFSNFHQTKGLERKIVFILGFDHSYNAYYNRDGDSNVCSNALYVAMSRAKERLFLFQFYNNLKFIDVEQLAQDDFVYFNKWGNIMECRNSGKPNSISAVRLSQVSSGEKLIYCSEVVDELYTETRPIKQNNILTNIVQNANTVESVSNITALALSAYFEYKTRARVSLWPIIDQQRIQFSTKSKELSQLIESKYEQLNNFTVADIEYWLRLANIYIACREELGFLLAQIEKYDWIADREWNNIITDMADVITPEGLLDSTLLQFEISVSTIVKDKQICGAIDILDNHCIWEIKNCAELLIDHKIQLMIYAYCYHKNLNGKMHPVNRFKLYNTKTGQIFSLRYDEHIISDMICKLLDNNNGENLDHRAFLLSTRYDIEHFNLKSVTVPQLKKLLKDNNVNAGKLKKAELLELCEKLNLL